MTQSTGTQQQQTSSQSSPWAPTQPLLQSLIGSLGNLPTGVTPQQQQAQVNYSNAAGGLPNFSGNTANISNLLLGGTPNLNQNLQNAFQTYQSQLSPFTNQNSLNPMNTPGLGTALQYIQNQVANNVNGEFAGAGRDLSPANSQAAAYGEAGALAPLIMGQYNTNAQNYLGSVGNQFQGANTYNSGVLGDIGAGTNLAGVTQNLALAPALAQLAAANQGYNLRLANLGGVEGLTLPIAGLGGQQQGTSQAQTSLNASPLQGAALGANAFGNFLNPFGGQFSPISGFGAFLGGL